MRNSSFFKPRTQIALRSLSIIKQHVTRELAAFSLARERVRRLEVRLLAKHDQKLDFLNLGRGKEEGRIRPAERKTSIRK